MKSKYFILIAFVILILLTQLSLCKKDKIKPKKVGPDQIKSKLQSRPSNTSKPCNCGTTKSAETTPKPTTPSPPDVNKCTTDDDCPKPKKCLSIDTSGDKVCADEPKQTPLNSTLEKCLTDADCKSVNRSCQPLPNTEEKVCGPISAFKEAGNCNTTRDCPSGQWCSGNFVRCQTCVTPLTEVNKTCKPTLKINIHHSFGYSPFKYIPGYSPSKFISGYSRIYHTGYSPSNYISGYSPTKYIPGYSPSKFIPGYSRIYHTGYSPSKYISGYLPSNYISGYSAPKYVPEYSPPKYVPGYSPTKYIPGYSPSKFIPGYSRIYHIEQPIDSIYPRHPIYPSYGSYPGYANSYQIVGYRQRVVPLYSFERHLEVGPWIELHPKTLLPINVISKK